MNDLNPKIGESVAEWTKRMPYAYLVGQKKTLSYVFAALDLSGKDPILEAITKELEVRDEKTGL